MENLGEALKIFLEKHLIPTLISIAISLIVLTIIPNNNWILNKLDKNLFIVLIFCLSFICVELIIWIFNKINISIIKYKNKMFEERQKIEDDADAIESWMDYADELPLWQRDLIINFIKNNNSPVEINDYQQYEYSMLKMNKVIYMTDSGDNKKMIKLSDNCYAVYKEAYDRYKRICHFDNE